MSECGRRVLLIGRKSSVLEGLFDLLELDGYKVAMTSSWRESEYELLATRPDLVVVDLSRPFVDTVRISDQIRSIPHWADVPLLFVSFSAGDHVRELQQHLQRNDSGQLHFFTHTVLSVDTFLDKVQACMC
jgi:CheY-like chemotaxis protein